MVGALRWCIEGVLERPLVLDVLGPGTSRGEAVEAVLSGEHLVFGKAAISQELAKGLKARLRTSHIGRDKCRSLGRETLDALSPTF